MSTTANKMFLVKGEIVNLNLDMIVEALDAREARNRYEAYISENWGSQTLLELLQDPIHPLEVCEIPNPTGMSRVLAWHIELTFTEGK